MLLTASEQGHPLRDAPPKFRGPEEGRRFGYPLRRFYFRALIAIFVPAIVAAHFIAIWRLYIEPVGEQGRLTYGRPGALHIFYSWFVISVLGLNLAAYGLFGVEASMLMEPRWSPQNAMQIMMHCERSWKGPGGWLTIATKVFFLWRQRECPTVWPSKLWMLLAGISALSYIALPISGLSMELSDGYVLSQNSGSATVVGRNYTSFEQRLDDDMIVRATERWRYAISPTLPRMGVAYAPETVDQSQSDWSFLDTLPNTLPVGHGVREIFLGPQADAPVAGTSWGVVIRYNCSVVTSLADFTILNHRNGRRTSMSRVGESMDTFILGRNQSFDAQILNVQAYLEVGSSSYEGIGEGWSWHHRYHDPGRVAGTATNYTPPVYNENTGIEGDEVLEIALWQLIDPDALAKPVNGVTLNLTLESTIPELGHEVEGFKNVTDIPTGNLDVMPTLKSLGFMPAIGARCTSNSAVGTAIIDTRRFTFRDFRPGTTEPASEFTAYTAAVRFSSAIPRIILQQPFNREEDYPPEDWLSALFSSAQSPRLVATQQSQMSMATGPLQPSELVRALLQAYASYAIELEYDSRYDFLLAYSDPNITAATQGKILTEGVIPPAVVVGLLSAWCGLSALFGCWYGFRRRWAQVLDGYSMFRFGADYADFVRSKSDFGSAVDFENCHSLTHIPGMVGNLAPLWKPGHIGLADGVYAAKGSLYA